MNLKNVETKYEFTLEFTNEEFVILRRGWLPDLFWYVESHLIWSKELEDILINFDFDHENQTMIVKLSENQPELLERIIQDFLNKATIA